MAKGNSTEGAKNTENTQKGEGQNTTAPAKKNSETAAESTANAGDEAKNETASETTNTATAGETETSSQAGETIGAGPDVTAEAEKPKLLNEGFKTWTKDEAAKVFGAGKPEQLLVLGMSITKLFYDHTKTSLSAPTFKEVIEFAGNAAKTINIEVNYTDDENLRGKIVISEFEHSITLPANGDDFTFGVDYSIGR